MASLCAFLETKLKLRVNREKSAVDRPWKRKFLGFSVYYARDGAAHSPCATDDPTAQGTASRLDGPSLEHLDWRSACARLTLYLNGWLGYYALADAKGVLADVEAWLRHRLRACVWVTWKRVRTRYRTPRAPLGCRSGKSMNWPTRAKDRGAWPPAL